MAVDPADAFLSDLESCLRECDHLNTETPTTDKVEYLKRDLDHFSSIVGIILESNVSPHLSDIHSNLCEWYEWIKKLPVDLSSCCTEPASLSTEIIHSDLPGRPKFDIPKETLEYLNEAGFSWAKISQMFNVSRSTLTARVREYGIQSSGSYSNITDEELLNLISEIHGQYAHAGCNMMRALLLSRCVKVTFARVHKVLRFIDPILSSSRWGAVIQRRKYKVKAANSLWHLDGHHALIRWGIVIHGCINGFSRMITYLAANSNNKSETGLNLFTKATSNFAVPSRVRGDKGSENCAVAEYMVATKGTNCGSFIAGRSTHNQRIEQLWRDVFRVVSQTFYSLFFQMEDSGLLDPSNEKDLFCLHFVFLPRLNAALLEFEQAWNLHALRTERSWSPRQIWLNSFLSNLDPKEDLLNSDLYGIDWAGPHAAENESTVEVFDIYCPLNEDQFQELQNTIPNCLENVSDFCLGLYQACKNFVNNALN